MTRVLLIRLVLACAFLFIAAPTHAADDKIVVRVDVFQFAPLIFLDDKGNAQGVFVDVIEEIAGEENWNIEYVYGTWNDGLEGVQI